MAYLGNVNDVYLALKNILNAILRPMWVDPNTSRVKGDVTISSGTVTTVTTVTTLTSMSQLSGFSTRDNMISPMERTNWAECVRNRIT